MPFTCPAGQLCCSFTTSPYADCCVSSNCEDCDGTTGCYVVPPSLGEGESCTYDCECISDNCSGETCSL